MLEEAAAYYSNGKHAGYDDMKFPHPDEANPDKCLKVKIDLKEALD